MISGAGESTCGNTRCSLHKEQGDDGIRPSLKVLELPFQYVEDGENKSALVKVTLCDKCYKKITWKRTKEKEMLQRAAAAEAAALNTGDEPAEGVGSSSSGMKRKAERDKEDTRHRSSEKQEGNDDTKRPRLETRDGPRSDHQRQRRRSERSRSPRHR